MSGSYFQPIKREFLNLSGGTVTGETAFTSGLTIINGNVGIGTATPETTLQVLAPTALLAEEISRFGISGVTGSSVSIINATSASGQFTPSLLSINSETNRNAFLFYGAGGLDTGTIAISTFDSRIVTSGSSYLNYGWSAATTRPLFRWANNGLSQMTMSAGGNLGIGISVPSAKLHINNTTTGTTFLAEDSSNPDATPFIIDTDGNVGIGTANPITKLHVSGDTTFTGGLTATSISATTYLGLPTDIRVTGGTYSAGTATFTNNTGGTFNVTGFSNGGVHNPVMIAGGTYTFMVGATNNSSFASVADRLDLCPYIPIITHTSSSLSIECAVTGTASSTRILLYSNNNGVPGTKIFESTDLDCSTLGVKTSITSQTFVAGTTYWIGTHINSSTSVLRGIAVGSLISLGKHPGLSVTNYTMYRAVIPYGSAPTVFSGGVLTSALANEVKITIV